MVTGEYNRNGYKVFRDGVEVYIAGNSPMDSAAHEPNPRFAVPLFKLAAYCRQTVKDIAAEYEDQAGGADRVADDD